MAQHSPDLEIARQILLGFDDYREHFRLITEGARARFEQAQWQDAQRASAAPAVRLAEKPEMQGKNIVVILPDSGERYLSSMLFSDMFGEQELQQ